MLGKSVNLTDRKQTERQYSAGGVVYKGAGEQENGRAGVLWLLIQPAAEDEPWRQDRWQLPKGWIEPGESGQEAALREVEEEGGVKAQIVDKIDRINIFFYDEKKNRVVKNIVFFLMEYQSDGENIHDQEVKEVVWLPDNEACERLTFKSEKEILVKAKKILAEKENQQALL